MSATEGRTRLPQAPWRRSPELNKILGLFAEASAEIRFVGGCVRDTLVGRPSKDVDLATPLEPDTIIALLTGAGIKVVPTGVAHGTVTAVVDKRPFEITTLRVDVETDGRHAVVAFTEDWRADAARRDFTMNALSATPDGTVYDYFGGVADLMAGRVRFVGSAHDRIVEDRLRILRFFRFHAHYGRPPPDAAAMSACRIEAEHLGRLSAERVRDETLKLLAAPDPVPAWQLMADAGVANRILGEDGRTDRLGRLIALEERPDPIRRLAALVHDTDLLANLATRLKLSNADRARLLSIADFARPASLPIDLPGARRLVYATGRGESGLADIRDRMLLAAADGRNTGDPLSLRHGLEGWPVPQLPISGGDAVALGVPQGPRVGELLAEVETWWVAGGFVAGREACLAELKRRIAEAGIGDP